MNRNRARIVRHFALGLGGRCGAVALLACGAVACGGGGKSNGGGSSNDASLGEDSSYGGSSGGSSGTSFGGSSGSSSGGSSGGSSSGTEDSGSEDATTDGASADGSGSGEGGSAEASVGADGGDASTDGGASSSSGGGADGGTDGSSGSGSSSSSGGSSSGADGGADGGTGSEAGTAEGGTTDGATEAGATEGGATEAGAAEGGATDGASDGATTCDLTGPWALRVDVQVTWPSTLVLAAGSGTVSLWALVTETQTGDSVASTVLPCGILLPPFAGPSFAGSPTFGVTFPNALFDGTYLTASSTTLTLSGSTPGATYTSPAEANMLGIAFANPTTASWPDMATAQADQVDMDMDGNPGVTANSDVGQPLPNDGGTYSQIPVGALGPYADQLYMAIRAVVALNGTLTSCTAASGPANVSHLDNHTLGCHLAAGGTCSSSGALSQAAFVDTNSPVFTVSSATFEAQALTTSDTCPNVRAALPVP
jgi:hypothetical protein